LFAYNSLSISKDRSSKGRTLRNAGEHVAHDDFEVVNVERRLTRVRADVVDAGVAREHAEVVGRERRNVQIVDVRMLIGA
jgi:hypothetical protein